MSEEALNLLVATLDVELEPSPLIEIETVRWRPTYGNRDKGLAIYLCETPDIGKAIESRIIAVRDSGRRVLVAIPGEPVILSQEAQGFLLSHDIEVIVLVDGDASVYSDLSTTSWERGLILPEQLSKGFSARKLNDALSAPKEKKGELLEQALAFMLGQVTGWKVKDVRRRTENEELDILIANNSARSPWNGSAYIMLEAKNWTDNVGRDEYDSFHMKVKERGGFCNLGIFVAAHGFSRGFLERASHHGSDGFSIVPTTVPRLIERLNSNQSIEEGLADRVEQVVIDRSWKE